MRVPDEFLYEYAVVRYVPRVDREEFINIGLIMMCKRRGWFCGRILIDQARIKAFDTKADIELLRKHSAVFERHDVPQADIAVEEKYRWLAAVKNAVIQVSPSHPGLLVVDESLGREESMQSLALEFNRLFNDIVAV